MTTVRDATFDVFRRFGMTTIFANPGSTEIAFLTGLPDDLEFVLALHEGVGRRDRDRLRHGDGPSGAGQPAHHGRAGQRGRRARDRAHQPGAAGGDRRPAGPAPPALPAVPGRASLAGLAGDYPVWVNQPARAQDVPSAVARAWHEANDGRGPALVIVPSDDWAGPAADARARRSRRAAAPRTDADPAAARRAGRPAGRGPTPALVVGADADDPATWAALVALAERLRAPVWQESFAARAGFPQDHPLFAGHLPAGRARLREALAGHDVVLAVGAPVFRQYPYEQGPFVNPGTVVALITDDLEDAHHSPVQLAVVAGPRHRLRRTRGAAARPAATTAPPAPAGAPARLPPRANRCGPRT